MIKKALLSLGIVALLTTFCFPRPLDLYEIQQSTAQIFVQRTVGLIQGSATCVYETDNSYRFITNAHVIGTSKNVALFYFNGGYRSGALPGTVIWKTYKDNTVFDLAVVDVEKKYFGNYPPRVIPFAPDGVHIEKYNIIYGAGCQNNQWPMSYVGHVEDSNGWIKFQPAPDSGQSGSAIFCLVKDQNGEYQTRVGGIVTWTDGKLATGVGGAVPTSVLYELKRENTAHLEQIKIPPNFKELVNYVADSKNVIPSSIMCAANENTQAIWPFNRQRQVLPNKDEPTIPPLGTIRPGIIIPKDQPSVPQAETNPFGVAPPDLGNLFNENTTPKVEPKTDEVKEPLIKVSTQPQSWFQYLRGNGYGWLQALGLASVIGIASLIWKKVVRGKTNQGIDKLQKNLHNYFAAHVGEEIASDFDDIIDGIQELLIGTVDKIADSTKQAKASVLAQRRQVFKGILRRAKAQKDPDKADILVDAIKKAGEDPAQPEVTPESAEILANIVKELQKEG